MAIKGIPLTRSVFVAPFSNILREIGAPTAPLLARFHLPIHSEEKPGDFVPLLPALRFVTTAQQAQGVADFGFLASQHLSFETFSDGFKRTVHQSPSLLTALENLCKFIRMEDNILRVGLVHHGDSLKVCYTNVLPGAAEMPHLEHAQWIQNMMTLYLVRQFAGADWAPANFAFQSHYRPSESTRERWPNTRFHSGEPATWIDVPASKLCLPPLIRRSTIGPSTKQFEPIETDFLHTLRLVLSAFLDAQVPNIKEAAEIAGTSVRTLQRVLAAADLTYPQLVNQVRFERGARLLRDPGLKIIDIAHGVGYDNPSHFARTFRAIAGVTPRQFRETLDKD